MLVFSCPACQKKISVKEELAGKKGKCTGCGQMVIPVPVAVHRSKEEMRPLPPSLGADPAGQDQRMNPSQLDSSDVPTAPPPSNSAVTQGDNKRAVDHAPGLTDFLAPPQADDELGRLGKYRVLKILGHGGMGVVYKAEDPKLKRSVAIKAMLPTLAASDSAGQRFLREAQAMATVEHDHIVRIYQVDEEQGIPFLAMEFLKGEPLDERLKGDEKLSLPEVLRIGREIAEGLGAAHATGLIHRDIKPANIWLEAPRGRVKILDFGLARAVSQDAALTQPGAMLGTPGFMAPEQARGEVVDARCDLFSLGCVLYRMCTGQQPFKGQDIMSTLLAVALEQPPSPIQLNSEIPQALSDLVMRLLEKDAALRPASAAEVADALQALELQARKSAPAGIAPVEAPMPQDQPARAVPAVAAKVSPTTGSVEAKLVPRTQAKAGRSRTPLLVALGLLALVPLVWWLATVVLRVETANGTLIVKIDDPEVEARIKNGKLILTGLDDKVRYTLAPSERDKKIEAGPYKIRVEGADGLTLDTPEFTLKKDGKVVVSVTVEPKAVVKKATQVADPDRKAAEYVLSIGGVVRVNGQDREIKVAADLPPELFRLTWVNLNHNKQVSDSGLSHFAGCKNLTLLELWGTKVSDAGLAYFKDCKNLTFLSLGFTEVSDTGLAHFEDCKNLSVLWLNFTKVSDAGLAYFGGCKSLTDLRLANTEVSDLGLVHFKDRKMTYLNLGATQVSDAGLAHFKDCKNLTQLYLQDTKVSDTGLAFFKGCKNLTCLHLQGTQVSNEGLANFKDCKSLTDLNLGGTQVSDMGLVHFKDCKSLTNLCLGVTQVSDDGLARFKGCKNLTHLYLHATKVSDAGLAYFQDCKSLTSLHLYVTLVSDAGLAYFKDCKNLTQLYLQDTKVSDTGLAYFKGCKNLTHLGLGGPQMSDVGLAHFKDCKNLTELSLYGSKVSDTSLAYFKGCKSLTDLNLGGTQVSDMGLLHFKDCKNLMRLGLQKTKVTAAKIEELKKALPKCKIEWP